MSVSLSLYIVLHFFVDLLCQINLPLEKEKKKKNTNCFAAKYNTVMLIIYFKHLV